MIRIINCGQTEFTDSSGEMHMITLVFCGEIKYCPYLKRYIERLDMFNISYEVLYWNRSGQDISSLKSNYYRYEEKSPENLGYKEKLHDFVRFRKWVLHHIKHSKPDGMVLLSTLTGIVLVGSLRKKKYIFDIRDYSFENNAIFRFIERLIVKNSFFTCISSAGFKNFLPHYHYVISHNFDRREMIDGIKFEKKSLPIDFVWNGTIRYLGFQKQYIRALANDDRFRIVFHGDGIELESFKRFCEDENIKNVLFTGSYNNADKKDLLRNAALLNNCYGGESGDTLRYAVSNRFYDGLIYRIPQIVEPGGYKASITEQYGVGRAMLGGSSFADVLFDYYFSIDEDEFDSNCNELLKHIIKEDDEYISQIDMFIKGMDKVRLK